jgi:hypothetical protein
LRGGSVKHVYVMQVNDGWVKVGIEEGRDDGRSAAKSQGASSSWMERWKDRSCGRRVEDDDY